MTDQFTEAHLERRIGDYIAAIAGYITNGEATTAIMADVRQYLAAATGRERADGAMLDAYDAGLLNDFGGGNVEWWQDYIRAELGRAHDFYVSQILAAAPKAPIAEGWRPIESAPKDGTHILAVGTPTNDSFPEVRETFWCFYGQGSLAYAAYENGSGPSGSWHWGEPQNNWGASWKPTHWMPLPAPPTTGEQK